MYIFLNFESVESVNFLFRYDGTWKKLEKNLLFNENLKGNPIEHSRF